MKKISLGHGVETIVDDEDFLELSKRKWWANKSRHRLGLKQKLYATTKIKGKTTKMHRLLLEASEGMFGDHINGNSLDNRRVNLRLVTPSQNRSHRVMKSRNSTGYFGVSHNHRKRWKAKIRKDKKTFYLGCFKTPIEAAFAYDNKAKEFFGEFATLNFP